MKKLPVAHIDGLALNWLVARVIRAHRDAGRGRAPAAVQFDDTIEPSNSYALLESAKKYRYSVTPNNIAAIKRIGISSIRSILPSEIEDSGAGRSPAATGSPASQANPFEPLTGAKSWCAFIDPESVESASRVQGTARPVVMQYGPTEGVAVARCFVELNMGPMASIPRVLSGPADMANSARSMQALEFLAGMVRKFPRPSKNFDAEQGNESKSNDSEDTTAGDHKSEPLPVIPVLADIIRRSKRPRI